MADKIRLLYAGKAKKVFETTDPDYLIVEYLDQLTALNGAKLEIKEGKGIVASQISNLLFNYLNREGIKTHHMKALNNREVLVKKLSMIPLEVVLRNRVAGSLEKRFKLERGQKIEPIIEFYYKNDELDDPFMCEDHIRILGLISEEKLVEIKNLTNVINQLLISLFNKANLELVDFKLEFGLDKNGELILADEISPDNCRIWDSQNLTSLDKDLFRQDSGDVIAAYQLVLKRLEEITNKL
ncbi:phosphoribosylaminoimidazolesuccinocarboxamide synthase [Facklamia sp. DSM 111018]|uniref:Phosphoribosylaminoimidazole-succinocarboxamide synthase n=1 Tax=Facklamia lactis TaxID=2749967 RepID=A0ABS0LMF7_9LACT|nr:phosphoribosylaminoimidazolesuccinocarboxamide synthase [Facklamia lactis]MBG9980008.1 phosphoribosylaminoimidazolesuccinocarboxamide synthase [Facklamia lactis]MBG9985312.1 phosphoribosylaminoimidazolesuccinocarboxamide synthase [Facklamia lactis]